MKLSAPMRWVQQEDAEGCGLAVLAMLTDKTYAEVKAEIDSQDGHGHNGDWSQHGITHITLDRYLITQGFYLQRVYASFGISEWPPDPWAPRHFAQVTPLSGNSHFVVMDAEGVVLDPMREGTYRLGDWTTTQNVVGIKR